MILFLITNKKRIQQYFSLWEEIKIVLSSENYFIKISEIVVEIQDPHFIIKFDGALWIRHVLVVI